MDSARFAKLAISATLLILTVSACGVEWFPSPTNSNSTTTTTTSSYTAICADGTLSSSANCSGTCSSHGGVSYWFVATCGHPRPIALCKDGKQSTSEECSAICLGNGGVQSWYTSACGHTVPKYIFGTYSITTK